MNTPTLDGAAGDAPVPAGAEPVLDAVSLKVLRAPAVHRLLALRAEGDLTRAHVHTTAQCLAVSDRTVWRWLADATATPATADEPGARHPDRFEITPQLRVLLAYWRGNASAVHRELLARARAAAACGSAPGQAVPPSLLPQPHPPAGGAPPAAGPVLDPVPSPSTLLRAVRDLTAGERAGYRKGPEAARALDVFGKRPRTWRNHTWEGDHVQARYASSPAAPTASKRRDYLADWMTGQVGREVRVRFMPHHTHEIEICDPAGHRLGTARLADQATPEQLTALRRARTQRVQRLRAEAKAAEHLRQERFAPATAPTAPHLLDAVTAAEATRELSRHHESRPPAHPADRPPGHPMNRRLPPAPTDQYVTLPEARLVATRALLTVRENLADTITARAMRCIHGGAGFGRTVAVTNCLRELEPGE
ncbi:hypothetical protein [Kitasatospora mediocidica]|uniref:hypothetical protein n=1 Tax=Kitasatospora mediocidica TaxID=58352 RepID=UPI000566748B|nr:hypothetical protein [Kitasatospora mediocidica]